MSRNVRNLKTVKDEAKRGKREKVHVAFLPPTHVKFKFQC